MNTMADWFDNLADAIEDVGSLELADVGRVARRGPVRRPMPRGAVPARAMIPSVPGVPTAGARLQPLGLGATAFTATSGTLLALTASPQRPFKAQRLVLDITRTGTTSTGLVTVTRLDIGSNNQLVASGALTAGAFAPTAFDVNLQLDPATPGITITVQLSISAAPTTTDRVDIGGMFFGTAIG